MVFGRCFKGIGGIVVYLGKGIYTPAYVARLIKTDTQKTRRWVKGYTYRKDAELKSVAPIFKREFDQFSEEVALSFLDLAELLFIRHFIELGFGIQKIRKAAFAASKFLDTDHPFALQKIYTDGKSIFATLAEKENDLSLLDLIKDQFQFEKIVQPTLTCLDFGITGKVEKWWPWGKDKNIALDPIRNMGQPILDTYNLRTDIIFDLYKAGRCIDDISDWYELDKDSVKIAIEFEKSLAA
ncbi:MAG: hypothetical protein FWD94_07785 [Treponema sp.]|nr:hypothetical protein [Treponema sp.]